MENEKLDVISRKALLAEYDRVHIGAPGGARKLIEEAQSVDAVEVVRCKDCKHREKPAWLDGYRCGNPDYGMASGVELKDDDFCSYGERRNNEKVFVSCKAE